MPGLPQVQKFSSCCLEHHRNRRLLSREDQVLFEVVHWPDCAYRCLQCSRLLASHRDHIQDARDQSHVDGEQREKAVGESADT